jgi:hypothetical protein
MSCYDYPATDFVSSQWWVKISIEQWAQPFGQTIQQNLHPEFQFLEATGRLCSDAG